MEKPSLASPLDAVRGLPQGQRFALAGLLAMVLGRRAPSWRAPVFTLGRLQESAENVIASRETIAAAGASYYGIGDLRRHRFLRLQPAAEHVHQPRDLRQSV